MYIYHWGGNYYHFREFLCGVIIIIVDWRWNKGIATTEKVNKDNFSPQTFDLTACTDSVTGQELGAQVRIYSVNYGGYTDFVTAKKGKKVTISSSEHNYPGTYRLNVRANTSSLFNAKLFGTWVLD